MQLQSSEYIACVCMPHGGAPHTSTSPPAAPCAAYQSDPSRIRVHVQNASACDDFVFGRYLCVFFGYYLNKLFIQKKALNIFVRVHFKHSVARQREFRALIQMLFYSARYIYWVDKSHTYAFLANTILLLFVCYTLI